MKVQIFANNFVQKKTSMEKNEFDHELRITKNMGWSLISMLFLGIFAEFVVRGQLINWEDPILTFTNVQSSIMLFELGIFGFIVIIILDVVLSISFYALFNSLDKIIGLLMLSLRLIYVAIKGFALVGLFLARDIYLSSVEVNSGQIDTYATQAMQFLKMHHYGFGVGLFFFGLHLIFLAILLLKVNTIPKLIAWMLLIGGTGYSLNSLASFFVTNFDFLENGIIAIFIIPMTFSELLLGIWLWIKRKKVIPILKK